MKKIRIVKKEIYTLEVEVEDDFNEPMFIDDLVRENWDEFDYLDYEFEVHDE